MLSASQITLYLSCPRKWHWRYVAKIPIEQSQTAAQALGTEVHRQLEEHFLFGQPLDYSSSAGYVAFEILKHLPEHPKDAWAEDEFLLQSPRHKYYGLIDLRTPTHIYDHKTTSSIKNYAKKDLSYDVQAILYATTFLVDYPEAPGVFVQWTYGQTKSGIKAHPVVQFLDRDHVGGVFEEIERVADEMASTVSAPSLQVSYDATFCNSYNKVCEYAHLCNLSAEEKLRSIMSIEKTDNLLARLSKRQNTSQINPPEAKTFEAEPTTVADTPKAKAESRSLVGMLFVGCEPSGKKVTRFEQLLVRAAETIVQSKLKDDQGLPVSDYRQIPYGKGAAALLQAVKQIIEGLEHTPILVLTYPNSPEGSIVVNYLSSVADIVIRPVG